MTAHTSLAHCNNPEEVGWKMWTKQKTQALSLSCSFCYQRMTRDGNSVPYEKITWGIFTNFLGSVTFVYGIFSPSFSIQLKWWLPKVPDKYSKVNYWQGFYNVLSLISEMKTARNNFFTSLFYLLFQLAEVPTLCMHQLSSLLPFFFFT